MSQPYSLPIQVNAPVGVSPATASVAPLGTATFKAKLTGFSNPQGGVTWSVVEPGGGSIDAAGKYTAPETAGVYTVKATSVEDPTQSGTATVTVPFALTVNPGSVNLAPGQSQKFTVRFPATPTRTWTGSFQTSAAAPWQRMAPSRLR